MIEPIISEPMRASYNWPVRCTVAVATCLAGLAACGFWSGGVRKGMPFLAGSVATGALAACLVAAWHGAKRRRIVIDPEPETVTFEHFRVGKSLLRAPTPAEFSCRFCEILDAHFVGDCLTVVTKRGVVHVDYRMSHFDEIREILSAASKETPPGPIYENPWFLLLVVLLAAALIIPLICWACT